MVGALVVMRCHEHQEHLAAMGIPIYDFLCGKCVYHPYVKDIPSDGQCRKMAGNVPYPSLGSFLTLQLLVSFLPTAQAMHISAIGAVAAVLLTITERSRQQ